MPSKDDPDADHASVLADLVHDGDSGGPGEAHTERTRGRRRRRNRILLIGVSSFLALIILLGAVFVGLMLKQVGRAFKGNPIDAIGSVLGLTGAPLKTDQYGNTNIVVFGTTEDDPGHDTSNSLTDSIMVISLNQKRKEAVTFSVPRDLWVTYPTTSCAAGTQGKINATYACGLNGDHGGLRGNEDAGQTALSDVVSRVLGIQLQYTVHVNMTVVRDAVNAVNGITIDIDSPDPRGISEPAMSRRCSNHDCVIDFPNGPVHLNGNQAMWLSQARNDGEGYGLPRGDFDRQMYQRKMAIAIEQKASAISLFARPFEVLDLLDAMGNNVRSNIPSDVLGAFIDAARKLPSGQIYSIDFDTQGLYTTGMYGSASIVRPVAGLFDYSGVQRFTRSLLRGHIPAGVKR